MDFPANALFSPNLDRGLLRKELEKEVSHYQILGYDYAKFKSMSESCSKPFSFQGEELTLDELSSLVPLKT